MGASMDRAVDPAFLDLMNYSICRATSELLGKDRAKEIFQRVGEISFNELKQHEDFKDRTPLDLLIKIANFLEEKGYIGNIKITQISNKEIIIDMYHVSVLESSSRLVEEGFEPSHYMTNLMFAALREFGLEAELAELEFDREGGHVKEKWILRSRKQGSTKAMTLKDEDVRK